MDDVLCIIDKFPCDTEKMFLIVKRPVWLRTCLMFQYCFLDGLVKSQTVLGEVRGVYLGASGVCVCMWFCFPPEVLNFSQ